MSEPIVNSNDVRRWIYEWFTRWEHRVPSEELTRYLATDALSLTFPGSDPITTPAGFAAWYEALLANTKWNFHELSDLTIGDVSSGELEVGMNISWHGEVADSSEWPTNLPGRRFRFDIHQAWHVRTGEGDPLESPFMIVTLLATAPTV